jgi:hypothetical protein
MSAHNHIRIIVTLSRSKLTALRSRYFVESLIESKLARIGKYTARRDSPHFQGDEYHGHCKLSGGDELSWTISGTRRHPNKFSADDKIPKDAKVAVAKVLGVNPNTLEAFLAYDSIEGKDVFVLQERISV